MPTGTRSLTPDGTTQCGSNCALTNGAGPGRRLSQAGGSLLSNFFQRSLCFVLGPAVGGLRLWVPKTSLITFHCLLKRDTVIKAKTAPRSRTNESKRNGNIFYSFKDISIPFRGCFQRGDILGFFFLTAFPLQPKSWRWGHSLHFLKCFSVWTETLAWAPSSASRCLLLVTVTSLRADKPYGLRATSACMAGAGRRTVASSATWWSLPAPQKSPLKTRALCFHALGWHKSTQTSHTEEQTFLRSPRDELAGPGSARCLWSGCEVLAVSGVCGGHRRHTLFVKSFDGGFAEQRRAVGLPSGVSLSGVWFGVCLGDSTGARGHPQLKWLLSPLSASSRTYRKTHFRHCARGSLTPQLSPLSSLLQIAASRGPPAWWCQGLTAGPLPAVFLAMQGLQTAALHLRPGTNLCRIQSGA